MTETNESTLHLVPETLLKKRHNLEELKAKRAAASITNPQISRKRSIAKHQQANSKSKQVKIIKPETILIQARQRKKLETRYNRVKKKGMMKRASDKSEVKVKVWDAVKEEEVELQEETKEEKETDAKSDEESANDSEEDNAKMGKEKSSKPKDNESASDETHLHKIPYKSNSIGATTVFAILLRPTRHTTPKPVKKTLSLLRLRRTHEGVFLPYNEATRKMLHLVEPYVLYGIPSMETISDLVRRRGFCRVEGKRVQLADNNLIEKELGDLGLICVEDLVQVLGSGGLDGMGGGEEDGTFGKVAKFLWPFRLTARKSKFQRKMLDMKDGKVYGDRGEAINGFIREML